MFAHRSHSLLCLTVALGVSCSGPPLAAGEALSEDVCKRDHAQLLADIETARALGVRQLQQAIDRSTSDDERAELEAQREQLWDQEEQQRVFADVTLRDCLRYVREQRAGQQ